MTLRVLGALADGEPTEQALCSAFAQQLDVSVAAVITLDAAESTATVTAWPHTVDILRMKVVLDRLPHAFPLLLRHLVMSRRPSCLSRDADPASWQGTFGTLLLHEVLGCEDIAQIPLELDGARVRIAVLASGRRYDDRAMHVLDRLRDPLATVTDLLSRSDARPAGGACHDDAPEDPGLTAREIEVLGLVAQGLLARTIAARLEVSPRTVHKHLGNAYRKLDAHDRLVAVRRAERLGIFASPPETASTGARAEDPERAGVLNLRW